VRKTNAAVNTISQVKRKYLVFGLKEIDSNLYTFPGCVLPARPALCSADALEIGTTTRASVKLSGLNHLIFTNPESTTANKEAQYYSTRQI
jgi:hypothetical protein